MNSNILKNLNERQHAAVTLPNEHALVLAGAGSGKTRVLTTRIAYLLQTQQVSVQGILAVTFTNKAAKEMMTRLSTMLPINVRQLWIGTFHGICHRFLRIHHQLAALPATFQILDMQDQLSAIKRLYKQMNLDSERHPPKKLQYFINACKEEGIRPAQVKIHDEETRRQTEMYALYEAQCQREAVVDFGELMLRSYELLQNNESLREHYQKRFQHILIDEFQDTSQLQYLWLKLFVGAHSSIFIVGDDDQSIYAFRGARIGNITDFLHEYNVKHQIKLEENYRSTTHILECANTLISHNKQRLGKNLYTQRSDGEKVRIVEYGSDYEEARHLVQEIADLIRGEATSLQTGYSHNEIAILYRSNAQSRVIETALFNAGIAYRVYGGLRFFERAEIKHALAYLRLLENPHDDTSFLRVINFPTRGIGIKSIEQLQSLAHDLGCSLYGTGGQLGGRAGVLIQAFIAKLDIMREQAQGINLQNTIQLVLKHSGLIEYYQNEKDGSDRIENLNELINAAESYVSIEGFDEHTQALSYLIPNTSLGKYTGSVNKDNNINNINIAKYSEALQINEQLNLLQTEEIDSLEPIQDTETGETLSPLASFLAHAALEAGDNQAQAGLDAVQLMTVHAAKGLEFDCVFIVGLEEGLFPHEHSIGIASGVEEERRLMYVAITRARKRLYLSHAQTRLLNGQTRYNIRSRFLDELPEGAIHWVFKHHTQIADKFTEQAPWHEYLDIGWKTQRPTNQPVKTNNSASNTVSNPYYLKKGSRVFHNKFGEGVVIMLEGKDEQMKAQINFSRHGAKWLALAIAKLTVIDE